MHKAQVHLLLVHVHLVLVRLTLNSGLFGTRESSTFFIFLQCKQHICLSNADILLVNIIGFLNRAPWQHMLQFHADLLITQNILLLFILA